MAPCRLRSLVSRSVGVVTAKSKDKERNPELECVKLIESIPGTTRKKVVGLERCPLSLVSTTEELLDRKVEAPD
jgi:hypothetical protein